MTDYRYARSGERSSFGQQRDHDRNDSPYGRREHRRTDKNRENMFGDWDRQREGRDPDERFGNYDSQRDIPINETSRLIASNKVEGTPVYSRRGERLGTIYNFMVNKRSGRVEYAVMTFGGFLGMGQSYYPLPWGMLTYDTGEDGYVVDISDRDLDRAPSYRRGEEPRFDEGYDRYVSGYYGLPF